MAKFPTAFSIDSVSRTKFPVNGIGSPMTGRSMVSLGANNPDPIKINDLSVLGKA
ncbi:hypothetical protein [Propionibacterium australiense]|uniref:hypothetical protein n=1 Tax=Propionibacterium australiense TaxID=119981 RepID=UPI0014770B2C|nr:hypothetical protein [Propionibacterium australiense]